MFTTTLPLTIRRSAAGAPAHTRLNAAPAAPKIEAATPAPAAEKNSFLLRAFATWASAGSFSA